MSDSEYDSSAEIENIEAEVLQVEKPSKKKKVVQPRTKAQLKALEQARIARKVKKLKKDQDSSLHYLIGTAVLSSAGLALYYYLKQDTKPLKSQNKSVPQRPIIQKIVQPVSELQKLVEDTVSQKITDLIPQKQEIQTVAEPAEVVDEQLEEPLEEQGLTFSQIKRQKLFGTLP